MSVPEEITYKGAPARVGRITVRTTEEHVRLVLAIAGPDGRPTPVVVDTRTRRVRREEVLAVRGPVPERARVTFVEDATVADINGKKERTVSPLAGQTFEVERKSERVSLAVFDIDGAPVRFGVAAQVAGQYRNFGRPPDTELPSAPQRVGKASPELARALLAGVASGSTIEHVDPPVVVLEEIRRGSDGALHGVYRAEVRVVGSSDSMVFTSNLQGRIILRDVDGALLEVRLAGPLTSEAAPEADPQPPPGAGELKLVQTMVYSQA